jgi:hypothetical protein
MPRRLHSLRSLKQDAIERLYWTRLWGRAHTLNDARACPAAARGGRETPPVAVGHDAPAPPRGKAACLCQG